MAVEFEKYQDILDEFGEHAGGVLLAPWGEAARVFSPRSERPMLDHLGGLCRWTLWGAQAHKIDFDAQARYFSLGSPESLSVSQKERKGALFIDLQRCPGMCLRALWGGYFSMRPTSGDFGQREGYRPYISGWHCGSSRRMSRCNAGKSPRWDNTGNRALCLW